MNGYWQANPEYMNYYLLNQFTNFQENGFDKQINLINKVGISILGLIGARWKNSWRSLALLLPINRSFEAQLIKLTLPYKKHILLQACAWGQQDLELSVLRRKLKWKSIFIPYTTDQLLCNGWLYDDYQLIFVQGALEKSFSREFHRLPERLIVELGSISARNLIPGMPRNHISCKEKKIIYAGSIARYFPLKSELEGLRAILEAQIYGELPRVDVVYRSFGESKSCIEEMLSTYHDRVNVSVEYVSDLFSGLGEYCGEISKEQLNKFIGDIESSAVLVTAGCTSLSLDAAFLGVPTVSYWQDDSGVLSRRNTKELFSSNGRLRDLYKEVPAAFTREELIEFINRIYKKRDFKNKIVTSIVSEWDFPGLDSYKIIKKELQKLIKS